MKTVLLLSAATTAAARLRSEYYPVKERMLSTPQFSLEDFLEEFPLTFNDDSPPKVLAPFAIDVIPTAGVLPIESLPAYEEAMDSFLTMELKRIYSSRPRISSVSTAVIGQQVISQSTSRRLQPESTTAEELALIGTELQTQVNVTFQNDPSPSTETVQAIVGRILGDLSYFATNLTVTTVGDEHYGSPMIEPVYKEETESSGATIGAGDGESSSDDEVAGVSTEISKETDRNIGIIVPLTIGACGLFAVIALLALRRRREGRIRCDGDRSYQVDDMIGDVDVFIDDDASDIFSFEAALSPRKTTAYEAPSLPDQSPRHSVSSPASSGLSPIAERSLGHESIQESDIFSGLAESPRVASSSKSIFSIFSGFSRATNADASTVMASNQASNKNGDTAVSPVVADALGSETSKSALAMSQGGSGKRQSGTPGSKISSLFTFSEEEDDDSTGGRDHVMLDTPKSVDEKRESPELNRIPPLGPDPIEKIDDQMRKPRNGDLLTPCSSAPPPPIPAVLSDDSGPSQIVGLASAASDPVLSPGSIQKDLAKANKLTLSRIACSTPIALENSPQRKGFFFGRRKSKTSPSAEKHADGYNSDPGQGAATDSKSPRVASPNLNWDRPWDSKKNAVEAKKFVMVVSATKASSASVEALDTPEAKTGTDPELTKSGRRHAKSTAEDGTTDYQAETMHMNMTAASFDAVSMSDGSELTEPYSLKAGDTLTPATVVPGTSGSPNHKGFLACVNTGPATPTSQLTTSKNDTPPSTTSKRATNLSLNRVVVSDTSGLTGPVTPRGVQSRNNGLPATPKSTRSAPTPASAASSIWTQSAANGSEASESSTTRNVISDLVWLEKKIATTKKEIVGDGFAPGIVPKLKTNDSMSFSSEDVELSPTGSTDSTVELGSPKYTSITPRTMQSIVCRDCFAPPGKLKIIIHSTKDGPAVHTVKPGSSLEGHIFAGDLIISVDGVDTRSYSAEQVMRMMTAKTRFERKITVLHFEEVVQNRSVSSVPGV